MAPRIPQRVGLLRGAGNAINPWVAAEFIKAYMQCR
jgi:DNA (cytosine-5)-methyltransferase 1